MNNPVIDTLVDNLTPKKPLDNKVLYGFYAAIAAVFTVLVLGYFGFRVDYQSAIESGAMFWKPAIFLSASIGGLIAMASLSRPQGKMPKSSIVFILFSIVVLTWQTFVQYPGISLSNITQHLGLSYANACLLVTFGGGVLLTLSFWQFWLKKTASSRPVLLGAFSGFTSANIAAASFTLYCIMDQVLYIVGFYGVAILAMTGLGALLGKKLLKW